MDDWLVQQVTLLGLPVQNWVIVNAARVLIAALINFWESK